MKQFGYISSVIILIMALGLSGCGGGSEAVVDSGAASCWDDTDGDGLTNCEETDLYGTSPNLADTDGDGFSDYEEIVDFGFEATVNNFKFNPLIADTPKIGITITSNPNIDLNYTDTNGTQHTTGTTRTVTDASTLIGSYNTTNGHKVENTNTAGGTLGVDGKGAPSAALNYQYTNVTTREYGASWTQTKIDDNRTVVTSVDQVVIDNSVSTNSGSLSYTIQVKNEGHIAFTLNNLLLSAVAADAQSSGLFEPVGNLQLQTTYSSYPTTTLGPGTSTADLVYSKDDLDLGTTLRLLKDSEGLVTQVAAYELLDADGRSFSHLETDIFARTAMVLIDYLPTGAKPQESFLVSTNADPSQSGVSAASAMQDILKIPYTTASGTLTGVRATAASASLNSSWVVVHVTDDGVTKTATTYGGVTAYDFDALTLHSGDVLHLVYLEDADGDGLGAREEVLNRTNPTLADTDGDTLSDLTEVRGWQITIDGTLVDVHSNPTRIDTDGDTINDDLEKTNTTPTDPRDTDTDGDRLTDNIDPFPVSPDHIDIAGLVSTATTSGALAIDLNWTAPANPNGVVVGVLFLALNDPAEPYIFSEPTAPPVNGVVYPTRGVGIGGWSVVSYITGVPLPTTLNDTKYVADTGVFKYIAYLNVDLTGNGVGDIYIRSGQSKEVPFTGNTDTIRVEITGIYNDACWDDIIYIGPTAPDIRCELYWFGYINGTRSTGLTRLESSYIPMWVGTSLGAAEMGAPEDTVRARVNKSCVRFQIILYDSDDWNTNTNSGDQYSSAVRPHCFENGWSPGAHTFSMMALDKGGKTFWAYPYTKYTVYYTVTVNP